MGRTRSLRDESDRIAAGDCLLDGAEKFDFGEGGCGGMDDEYVPTTIANQLTTLPEELGALVNLREIDLSGNPIAHFPHYSPTLPTSACHCDRSIIMLLLREVAIYFSSV